MDLPRIPNPTPITVPAQAEKTFPDFYLSCLRLHSDPQQGTDAELTCVAYNKTTQELGPHARLIRKQNLDVLAAQRVAAGKPALAQAMAALVIAVAELIAEEPE
jgi:hypothetical protein